MSEVADSKQRSRSLNPLLSFSVVAPAGSGKTELLIQRCLTLLARVEHPEEVLAVTFTRKAAAEMRERIIAALQAATLHTEVPNSLDTHQLDTWRRAREVLLADASREWQLLDSPGRLNIKTIDSFSAGLTRELPVLANFGGAIAPVDDASSLYLRATRELLALLESDHPQADDLADLLLNFDNNWTRLEALLVRMLSRRDEWLRHIGSGLGEHSAATVLQNSYTNVVGELLVALSGKLGSLIHPLLELANYGRGNLGLELIEETPGTDHKYLSEWKILADFLLTQAGTWRKSLNKNNGFPADDKSREQKKAFMALLGELKGELGLPELLGDVRLLPETLSDDRHWRLLLSLSRLLPLLVAQLSLVFQQEGAVDHNQIAISAREALGNDDSPTELALKLDYRLRHILVDEFQDTAANQYELVRRLTRGWQQHNLQNPENPNTLFIVGDGMQSIYGFRDADVSLFMRARREGFNGLELEAVDLLTNFRSDPALVEWVNRTFAEAFPRESVEEHGAISFSPATAHREGGNDTPVNLVGFSGEQAQSRLEEARFIADRVEEGIATSGVETMAVLVRNRSHLLPIVRELKARQLGWQAQDIDSLADSPVVMDLLLLCKALYNHADRVAWLALLRAPWCGLQLGDLLILAGQPGEFSIWTRLQDSNVRSSLSKAGGESVERIAGTLQHAITSSGQLSLREWIEVTWLALGGPAAAGISQLGDAEAFFKLLEEMDSRGETFSPSVLEERVAKLYAADSSADGQVQLMTLHKSKGLEFDWVLIPGLSRVPRPEGRELLLWQEYQPGSDHEAFLLAMDDQGRQGKASLYNFLQERKKRRAELESTRLLYVGATRARQRLWLTGEVVEDEQGGEWKSPPQRSLLSSFWPSFAAQLNHIPAAVKQHVDSKAKPAGTLRRLVLKDPAHAVSLDSSIEEATPYETGRDNIPRRPVNSLQRHVGTVVHLCLQRLSQMSAAEIELFDPETWGDWWLSQLRALGVAGAHLPIAGQRVGDSVRAVVADSRGRYILSCERQEAASEYAISSLAEDGRLVEQVIDRTWIEDGVRWVVDYKSSVPESGEELAEFLARERLQYLPQLEAYRATLLQLDNRPTKLALYFTALPHWLEIVAENSG